MLKDNLNISKLNGKYNPGDLGTKAHTADEHDRLSRMIGLRNLTDDMRAIPEVAFNARLGTTGPSATKAALLALCVALQTEIEP